MRKLCTRALVPGSASALYRFLLDSHFTTWLNDAELSVSKIAAEMTSRHDDDVPDELSEAQSMMARLTLRMLKDVQAALLRGGLVSPVATFSDNPVATLQRAIVELLDVVKHCFEGISKRKPATTFTFGWSGLVGAFLRLAVAVENLCSILTESTDDEARDDTGLVDLFEAVKINER